MEEIQRAGNYGNQAKEQFQQKQKTHIRKLFTFPLRDVLISLERSGSAAALRGLQKCCSVFKLKHSALRVRPVGDGSTEYEHESVFLALIITVSVLDCVGLRLKVNV